MFNVQQKPNGDIDIVAQGNDSANGDINIYFTSAVKAIIGRGTTDTDIAFLGLTNGDGEMCYIFPNAAQNAIVVQSTRP